ncbi:MAG: hypothetical protein KBF42_08605 [Chitinophagales bacterium]|nr:hypothetical protein [Chitinophagales bacterium]MBP9221431.1 hypothetical protein [Chitinophagales bacterium]MBP9797239.1 hypothetical protein [Chitinophagales bacterium]
METVKIETQTSEIETRKHIWIAISEFYLDTELSESDISRITSILKSSNLDLKILKQIDLYEVFPVLQANLLSPAGVWDGFEENWLLSCCEKSYYKRKNKLYRLNCKMRNYFRYWMRKKYWDAVEICFINIT